jgi:hypothetical protein
VDTAKKVDPEEEKRLVDYIQNELLRGKDQVSIRSKLLQAGWQEVDVLRLIEAASTKPDFKPEKPKVLDIEPVLVFQPDGNLRLKREIIDGQVRKKRAADPEPLPIPIPDVTVEKPKMTVEEKARLIRLISQTLFTGLLFYHAWLLVLKFTI